jgi:hypothetical protein
MHNRHRVNVRVSQQSHSQVETKEHLVLFVIDVELEEIVRQLSVMNRMPGIHPFTEENIPILQPLFQDKTLNDRPLLEQIVLRVHSLRNQMASALENQLSVRTEVDADVRAVDLLLDDQRRVGNNAS